uniref:Uncharacterized protein n=1 Tax=Mycena chlorophos TaxID=658473 RepID=A0ABQ0L880_MYCCL|nr:predicted protein [Mycena chlorophos]
MGLGPEAELQAEFRGARVVEQVDLPLVVVDDDAGASNSVVRAGWHLQACGNERRRRGLRARPGFLLHQSSTYMKLAIRAASTVPDHCPQTTRVCASIPH